MCSSVSLNNFSTGFVKFKDKSGSRLFHYFLTEVYLPQCIKIQIPCDNISSLLDTRLSGSKHEYIRVATEVYIYSKLSFNTRKISLNLNILRIYVYYEQINKGGKPSRRKRRRSRNQRFLYWLWCSSSINEVNKVRPGQLVDGWPKVAFTPATLWVSVVYILYKRTVINNVRSFKPAS